MEEREKTVKSSAVLQVCCEVGKERKVGGPSPATVVREVRSGIDLKAAQA